MATAAAAAAPADTQCDLPKNVVKRIVKEKLAQAGKGDLQVNKEALLALGESAKVFISFITAAANDVCKEKKRATINADDVFAALEDLEFGDLLPALKESFEAYKASSKEKKEKKAEVSRKRKSEAQEAAAAAGGDGSAAAAAADGQEEPADTTAASDKSGGDAGASAAAGAAAAAAAGAAGGDAEMEDAAAEEEEGAEDGDADT